jgi:bifunctional UDP-N-acetylglucosamine pyrophosphorylase/glucosamine-1-phosphate N-acetyltransferase
MELQPRGYKKVIQLIDKGANIPNPTSLHIGDEVDLSRVSARGLTIYPGCRIYGAKTVISPGAVLGAEAPVTLEDCALGPKVELKGGYFKQSVFLEKANMGLGAQVREACLLEEEASGAHCVGMKQTILFPFVTLGSLINFCDCLMAGGTSRKDHSEVGSSYIHFNYTPDGDKTTASMFGDVPRGVMLNQPPIFLGGQGGAVGPLRLGYGSVVAAGSVLRDDVAEDRRLVFASPPPGLQRDHSPHVYKNLSRIVRNNVVYLANLVALEEWYRLVRHEFFARQDMGELIYTAVLEGLATAKDERAKRLEAMAAKVPAVDAASGEFCERVTEVCALFRKSATSQVGPEGEEFLTTFLSTTGWASQDYVETIQSLTPDLSAKGTEWLQRLVDGLCQQANSLLPSMDVFDTVVSRRNEKGRTSG